MRELRRSGIREPCMACVRSLMCAEIIGGEWCRMEDVYVVCGAPCAAGRLSTILPGGTADKLKLGNF